MTKHCGIFLITDPYLDDSVFILRERRIVYNYGAREYTREADFNLRGGAVLVIKEEDELTLMYQLRVFSF